MNIKEFLNKKRLICDGGFGTMLQNAGLPAGEAPEKWNITHPDIICDIHKAYIDAGSDIITVNTFGINTLKYEKSEAQSMIFAAFDCARRAKKESGRQDVLLALDIGPSGRLLEPYGDLDFEDAVSAFSFVAKCGADCGADVVFIETMNDSYETKAAVVAVKENCNIPIFVTNVYDDTNVPALGFCGTYGTVSTVLRIFSIYSGVVPQHPPNTAAPIFAISAIISANSSAPIS